MRLRRLTVLCIAVVLCGCCLRIAAAQPAYPDWFLETPTSVGVLYAVGYAPVAYRPQNGYAAARAHAEEQLKLARHATVEAEQLFETFSGRGAIHRGERTRVEPSPGSSDRFAVLDSVRTDDLTLVLVATTWVPISPEWVKPQKHTPDWVTEPQGAVGHYAVGIAPRYFYPLSSWLEAEYQARIQLAYSIMADHRSLTKYLGNRVHAVSATRTAVALQGTQVVARWQDEDTFYVLMRADAASVLAEEQENSP